MTEPLKVVFVDDEPMVLRSIERLLRARKVPWIVRTANTAQDALALLEREIFDVIVSDLRMPGVDGAALLREVRTRFPRVARLVLSGQAATREGLEAMQVAHQCLAKPYDLATLRRTVEGLARARARIADPVFAAVSQIASLPSPDRVYRRLVDALSAGTPLRETTAEVETDPALTAKILQLNRSAAIGVSGDMLTIADALPLLEAELGAAFQLGEEVCRPLRELTNSDVDLKGWQDHSVMVARVARAIAPPALRGKAFVAGILHDVGHLVAACLDPALTKPAIDHCQLGACLLELWGLDEDLVEAVASHHDLPGDAMHRSALIATLYLAEYVVSEAGVGRCAGNGARRLTPPGEATQVERAREILRQLGAAG